MITRLEEVHSQNYIHRDIKPENFVIGRGKKVNEIYIIDFGLAKQYICSKTGNHLKMTQRYGITGTPHYCSLNTHLFYDQSRRDDLESLGYTMIYMAKNGILPWTEKHGQHDYF